MGRHPRPGPDPAQPVRPPKVAGVAGGLARHLDIDPVILRVAFVVLTFFGGVGLLLYVALLAAPARGRQRLGEDQARPPQPHRRPGHRRRLALLLLVSPRLVGRRRMASSSAWSWSAAAAVISTQLPHRGDDPPHVQQGEPCRRHHRPSRADVRDRHAVYPASRLRVRRARAAAPGQPAQEGPDPVLVRAGGDGRRPRCPRDRRPGRRRRRALGVPRDGARAERCLPPARRVLRPGRRDHPGRARRRRGHRRHHGRRPVGPPQHDRASRRARAQVQGATRWTSARSGVDLADVRDPAGARRTHHPRDRQRRPSRDPRPDRRHRRREHRGHRHRRDQRVRPRRRRHRHHGEQRSTTPGRRTAR